MKNIRTHNIKSNSSWSRWCF